MMNCEQIKNWMMDYLYEELSDLQKPLFEEHMQRCADCRKVLSELQDTSAALAKWPEAELTCSLPLPLSRSSWWQRWQEQGRLTAPRWAMGLAMAAMLILVLLAAVNTQISNSDGHWQISMSLHARPAAPALPEGSVILSRQDLLTLEQERWRAIQAYVQQSELKQQKEWSQAMSRLAQAVQVQRSQDLQLVSRGLEAIGEETAQRFQLTDYMLAEVLRFASAEQNNMQ